MRPYLLALLGISYSVVEAQTIRQVPAQYQKIQSALNSAQPGDTILVQPGTYSENILWPNVNGIKLLGVGDTSNTIIDGAQKGSAIHISPDNNTVTIDTTTEIKRFRIMNGGGVAYGGGIFVSGASPKLEQLRIVSNTASQFGGGLYLVNSSNAILRGLAIEFNKAENRGGGIFVGGNSRPIITNVIVKRNDGSFYGGGMFVDNSSPSLEGVVITENVANSGISYAGGLYLFQGVPNLRNVDITKNTTNGSGGGIYTDQSTVTLTNVFVGSNSAQSGGGIYIVSGQPTFNDVQIIGNVASSDGGGLFIYTLGGIPIFENLKIIDNVARNDGGGLYTFASYSMTHAFIGSNSAARNGGTINIFQGSPVFTNTTFYSNSGSTSGRGIYVSIEASSPKIQNSNFYKNGLAIINSNNAKTIDATANWWGSSTGPYQPLQNPNGLGDSVSNFVSVVPFLSSPDLSSPLIPISNLSLQARASDFVDLKWDASQIGNLAGYKIYYDTDSTKTRFFDKSVDVGNLTSYRVISLTPGKQYYFYVTCYNAIGRESWYSKRLSVSTSITIALSNGASNISSTSATLNGIVTPNGLMTTSYFEFGQTSNLLVFDTTASQSIGSGITPIPISFNLTILTPNTTYYFRISAKNVGGMEKGSIQSFTTIVTAPSIPTLLFPANNSINQPLNTILQWNAVPTADSYRLQLTTNQSFSPTLINDSTLTTTSRAVGPLSLNTTYYWRVSAKNLGGSSSFSPTSNFKTIITTNVELLSNEQPKTYSLLQNFPNPFNPITVVEFSLPTSDFVSLVVFDNLGQRVQTLIDEQMAAGRYRAQWNAVNAASGVYFYQLRAGEFAETKKLILIR